jgi:hypothetical protein
MRDIVFGMSFLITCILLGKLVGGVDPNTRLDKLRTASPWIYDEDEEDSVVVIH